MCFVIDDGRYQHAVTRRSSSRYGCLTMIAGHAVKHCLISCPAIFQKRKCFVRNWFRMCWEVILEYAFTVLQAQELMPTGLIKVQHPWSCFSSGGLLFLGTTHFPVLKLRFFRLVAGTAHASPAGDLRTAVVRRAGPAVLLALSYPCAIQRISRDPVCMVSSSVVPLALLNVLTTGENLWYCFPVLCFFTTSCYLR